MPGNYIYIYKHIPVPSTMLWRRIRGVQVIFRVVLRTALGEVRSDMYVPAVTGITEYLGPQPFLSRREEYLVLSRIEPRLLSSQ